MLQSMGLQRVRHDLATDQQLYEFTQILLSFVCFLYLCFLLVPYLLLNIPQDSIFVEVVFHPKVCFVFVFLKGYLPLNISKISENQSTAVSTSISLVLWHSPVRGIVGRLLLVLAVAFLYLLLPPNLKVTFLLVN